MYVGGCCVCEYIGDVNVWVCVNVNVNVCMYMCECEGFGCM